MIVAIVHEDDKMVRLFKDDACIYSAYKWCHRHYCLEDYEPELPLHKLPDWLKITIHILTDEQVNELVL